MEKRLNIRFKLWVRNSPIINFVGIVLILVTLGCEKQSASPFDIRDNVKIFPNPARTVLNIASSIDIEKIDIVNDLGQSAFSSTNIIHNYYFTVNVSLFPAGIYKVILETQEGSYNQKVLIIK